MNSVSGTSPAMGDGAALTLTQREAFAGGWREGEAFVLALHTNGPRLGHEQMSAAFADTLGEIVCAGSACDWNDEAQVRFEGFALCIGEALFLNLARPAANVPMRDIHKPSGAQETNV